MEKIEEALRFYLDLEEGDSLEYEDERYDGGYVYSKGDEEYLIFDNYDDVEKAVYEDVEQLIEDDVNNISWDNLGGIENYIKSGDSFFEDAMRESYYHYLEEIRGEKSENVIFLNRLHEEMIEAGYLEEEGGLIDGVYDESEVDSLVDSKYDDYLESLLDQDAFDWFVDTFGTGGLDSLVDRGMINIEKLSKDVMAIDGAGNTLASYDGIEDYFDYEDVEYFVYRLN